MHRELAEALMRLFRGVSWSRVYKNYFVLNSAEHEIFSANKYEMPTIVGIFIFICIEIFMFRYAEQERIYNL